MPPSTSRRCPKPNMMRPTGKSPGRREQWAGNAFANRGAAGLEQKRTAVSGRWRAHKTLSDLQDAPPTRGITFFARWLGRRGARYVARRALFDAPDAALRVPCVVPD